MLSDLTFWLQSGRRNMEFARYLNVKYIERLKLLVIYWVLQSIVRDVVVIVSSTAVILAVTDAFVADASAADVDAPAVVDASFEDA